MRLQLCAGCAQHVAAGELRCPFCSAPLRRALGRIFRGAATVAMCAGMLGTSACTTSPGSDPAEGDSSSTAAATTSGGDTETPTPGTSTSGSASTGAVDGVVTDTGSSTEDGDDNDDWDDNGCSFYAGCSPDVGDDFPFECDIYEQDCDEPDEKCMPWSFDGGPLWNGSRCTPIATPAAAVGEVCAVEGNPVSGIDDCVGGAMCFGVDTETNLGVCIELCSDPEGLGCSGGNTCAVLTEGVPLCVPPCNPLAFECGEGEGCFPIGETFHCLPPTTGGGAQGEACNWSTDCDPGLACQDASLVPGCTGKACCTSLCDEAAATCPGGLQCASVYRDGKAPDGFEDLGVCVAPQ